MGLKYPHTCPIIDRTKNDIETTIGVAFDGIINETSWSEENIAGLLNGYCRELTKEVLGMVEDLRDVNSDMRNVADNQIDELEDEKAAMFAEIYNLREKIDQLEYEKRELEYKLNT